ncbi:hypothetical protein SteCoe_357 [Stentor coeruleus]|uniref:Uncharacterized protein n=1 Tax=Stentor coeruleus TaxID=5963 RepID=A0A1R2D4I3_9CILI|nr:hypothetical protein SteCoe_357 [Stentor coeruleus]
MEPYIDRMNNPASLICFRYTNQGATSIPEIKNFKNLTELDISENCLTQEVSELSCLKYLKKLTISSSHLMNFWNFPRTLEYLNISCNHIAEIPEIILPKLQFLDISCNYVTELQGLSELSALRALFCGYNLISSLEFLKSMSNLVEVDLEHNLICDVEKFSPLMDSDVLAFVVRNNPAEYSDFARMIEECYEGVVEKNDVYFKDVDKAQSLKLRLVKQGFGGNGIESFGMSKIRNKYMNHVAKKDIIHESEEIHEGLMTEVEGLRKIIDANESQLEQLKTQQNTEKKVLSTQDIEKLLMRLHEIQRENLLISSKISKLEKYEYNYRAKYILMCTTLKKLKQNCKELKAEIDKKRQEIEGIELEKFTLNSDITYFKIENKALKSEITQITQKFFIVTSKNPSVVNKQVLKSNSSKTICKSSIPKIKFSNKDMVAASPLSNVSLSTVTKFTKRRDSFDNNSRILRSMPTSKVKASSEKPLRSKKRSFQ